MTLRAPFAEPCLTPTQEVLACVVEDIHSERNAHIFEYLRLTELHVLPLSKGVVMSSADRILVAFMESETLEIEIERQYHSPVLTFFDSDHDYLAYSSPEGLHLIRIRFTGHRTVTSFSSSSYTPIAFGGSSSDRQTILCCRTRTDSLVMLDTSLNVLEEIHYLIPGYITDIFLDWPNREGILYCDTGVLYHLSPTNDLSSVYERLGALLIGMFLYLDVFVVLVFFFKGHYEVHYLDSANNFSPNGVYSTSSEDGYPQYRDAHIAFLPSQNQLMVTNHHRLAVFDLLTRTWLYSVEYSEYNDVVLVDDGEFAAIDASHVYRLRL